MGTYSYSWIRPGFVIAGDGDLDLEKTSDNRRSQTLVVVLAYTQPRHRVQRMHLKPNCITLAGLEPAPNQLQTCSDPAPNQLA